MPFRIALSGLNAASSDLSITAHNIANVNTLGFKQSRPEFADVLSRGVRLSAEAQQFAQGTIDFTGNALDLAITGEGFFTLSEGGDLVYARAGAFGVDAEGFVVNSDNQRLQVYPEAGRGIFDIGSLQDLRLSTAESAPQATTSGEIGVNLPAAAPVPPIGTFDPADPGSFNHATSTTIYDSLGEGHTATLYFVKDAAPNSWTAQLYVDGTAVGSGDTLIFDANGNLATPAGGLVAYPPYDPANGANPVNLEFDFIISKQFGGEFAVNNLNQDGFPSGRITGLEIDASGVVFARFTNGRSQSLGQIAMTNFTNVQGLKSLGDNTWAETFASGEALRGEAGTARFGLIQAGGLEQSNVDLTAQLVNMIEAQRNFQANAQMISTADQITQTIINNIR